MSTEPIKSWTRLLESSSSDYATIVIISSDGSIYTSGYTSVEYVLKRYNSDGSKSWTRSLGSTAGGEADADAISIDGSIYVAGYREDNLYGTINGVGDGFLSKYSSDGSKSWTRLVGSSEWDSANSVTISSDGSVYLAGRTLGNLDGNSNAGNSDAYLSKYSSDGSKSWTRMLGSSEWDSANEITTSNDGSIYVAGRTEGNLDGNRNNDGDSDDGFSDLGDAFLSKYNSDGSKSWTRLLGSFGREDVYAVTTSSDGSIYIAGSTSGNLDGNNNAGGGSDAFLSKYNSDGSKSWTRLLGSSGYDYATIVTTSNDGSIYIGVISERYDTFGNPVGSGASVSRYNSDGFKSWTQLLESPEYDWVNSVATSSDGSIYVLESKDKGITGNEYFSRSDLFLTKYTLKNGNGTPGAITGSGAFREGVTLSAPVVTGDPDGDATNPKYSYQWYKGGNIIAGATASTYAVPASGAGNYKVAVTYTDAQGFTATLDSPEQVVSTFNNGNGTPASITGNGAFQEGVTLSAPVVTGDPDGDATNPNYAYQWFKGSTAITNATASTYAVPAFGAGTYKVAVTYTDAQGFTATVDSPEQVVSTFNNGNGTAGAITSSTAEVFQEGVTLTAPVVTGDPDGDALNPNYSYQWYKGGNLISGATASTYAVSASGAGTYKVAVTYTDAQGFIATLDSPEQVVIKPIPQKVDIAPSQRGSLFRVESAAAPEVIVNLKGSSDLIEINAEVSATLNAVTTENWSTGYVAWNVGSTIQAGTGERVSLNGLGKYSFVATAINAATSTIVLEQDKNTAFFLHDAYSAFYEGLTLSTDSTGRQSAARILDFDVIKMGSAGGNSIVDLTSKDYITGAVTVHGADKGRSIFWGTDSDDTFLSGGGDSVIFGGGGFNQSILGAGKDVLQFRSTVDSTNLIQGFDPAKDVLELWSGRTETVEAPTFITEGNSTTMNWGSNSVQFAGLTGITAESLLISTQFAA